MLVLPCRDLSCRVLAFLVLSNLTICCLVLSFRCWSMLVLPCRDLSCRVFSFLVLSNLTLCCLVLSCRFMSMLVLPCPLPSPNPTLTLTNPITLGRKHCWEVLHLVIKTKIICFDFTYFYVLPGTLFALRTSISCLKTFICG